MYSFEDFHFSSIMWNTYVLYHEYYSLTGSGMIFVNSLQSSSENSVLLQKNKD